MYVVGKERVILEEDHSVVTVRPKHYVGSSGSVWASEKMLLRWEHPQLFEVEGSSYKSTLRKFAAMVWDYLFYFVDTTEYEDVSCVTSSHLCKYREYETTRVAQAMMGIVAATTSWSQTKESLENDQIVVGDDLLPFLDELQIELQQLNLTLTNDETTGDVLWQMFENTTKACKKVLEELKRKQLPVSIRPRVLIHTDKGPGVSVTNYEVKFRDAEMVRIHNLDWQMRAHYAVNDPCPAERTNACIGNI